jgi:phosphatidylinositol-4,5-bisphosphate 3-kinase
MDGTKRNGCITQPLGDNRLGISFFFTLCVVYLGKTCSICNVGSNPNKDAPCLEVEFDRLSPMIFYPDGNAVEEYGRFVTSISIVGTVLPTDSAKMTSNVESLLEIQAKDPLSELSEQEKDMLWEMRHVCCKKVPDALPKLLEAVKWNSRDNVAQVRIS